MSIHSGHRQRCKKEFLTRGLDGLEDYRVLELLLFYAIPQGDVNELAHALIDRFHNLAGVLDASVDELEKVKGVGEHTAVLLKLIPAMGARYVSQRVDVSDRICTVDQAADRLQGCFLGAVNEKSVILCLDSKNKFLGIRKVAEGSIHAADISIRRITEEALGLRATKIYLAHNHPSELAFPSQADWDTTDTIRAALAAIGLELVDHLIFTTDDVVSLRESEADGMRPVYQLM